MWVKGKWIKVGVTKQCLCCDTEFTTTDHRAKFCSSKCRNYLNGKKFRKENSGTDLEYYIKYILLGGKRSELSLQDTLEIYNRQDGLCALTGIKMTSISGSGRHKTNMSIDRIEVGGPYIKDNIRLVCVQANTIRNDLTDEEMLWWCKQIIKNPNGQS